MGQLNESHDQELETECITGQF